MSSIKIAPSILSADFSQLGNEIKRLEEGGADMIHVDVMDGHFVPNLTIGPPVIKTLRNYTKLPFDVHLMIAPVHKYIKNYAEAGADIITIHPEATDNLKQSIDHIKNLGKKVGISLNPNTQIDIIKEFLAEINLVLIMSVHPGFGGQKFMPEVLVKIKELKKIKDQQNLNFDIEVDGGINFDNSKLVIDAGANILVSGTTIFKNNNGNNKKNIDIFINNAGITGLNAGVWDYPVDEWQKVINVNLNAVFYCCKAVVPHMIKNNYGRIVNIASISGKEGNANASAYSSSKAGVIGLTKSLGKELADKNIAVNAVTPAGAKTRILDQMTKEHVNFMLSKVPRNRFLEVDELASLVAWLASEENSFSTGAVFDISGGRATY